MFELRMAGAHLMVGLYFQFALGLWLPAIVLFCVGALWSAYAYDQMIEEEEECLDES